MKLIYIAPFLHMPGGLEHILAEKANWLVAHGHEVQLLTYTQNGKEMFYALDERVLHRDLQCPLYVVYKKPLYKRPFAYLQCRRQFRQRFAETLSEYHPDVLVITIPNTEEYIHDMLKVAHQQGVKVIVECHLAADYHLEGKPLFERLLSRLFPSLKAIQKSDLLITLTDRDADSWRRFVKRVSVLPNPLPLAFSQEPSTINKEPSTINKEPSTPRIIAVGRLFSQKRFDRLIEAFALIADHYPQWQLDIYGDGPFCQVMQQQIAQCGMTGRIMLNGTTHDMQAAYKKCQFFVLSSDYEGFGMVIIEAMACGLPVVATDCPCGPAEIIEDGRTGLLSRLDVQDLAKKMEWMMSHEAERQKMGQQALLASAHYQLEQVMPRWLAAYQSVL